MKLSLSIFTLFSVFLLLSHSAYAQNAALHDACEKDARMFCEGVQPGEGRIIHCLMDHRQDLSDDCKAGFTAMAKHQKAGSPDGPSAGSPNSAEGNHKDTPTTNNAGAKASGQTTTGSDEKSDQ